jgi:hypothetical protein
VVRALLGAYDDRAMVSTDRIPLVATLRAQCLQVVSDAMPAAFAEIATQPDRMGMG